MGDCFIIVLYSYKLSWEEQGRVWPNEVSEIKGLKLMIAMLLFLLAVQRGHLWLPSSLARPVTFDHPPIHEHSTIIIIIAIVYYCVIIKPFFVKCILIHHIHNHMNDLLSLSQWTRGKRAPLFFLEKLEGNTFSEVGHPFSRGLFQLHSPSPHTVVLGFTLNAGIMAKGRSLWSALQTR